MGLVGFLGFALAGCHEDNGGRNAGTGGAAGDGTGGFPSSGGAQGIGGSTGLGGSPETVPPEWGDASVEAGIDCSDDAGDCGPDSFCGIAEFDGVRREHRCFSKGSCETCECLTKTFSAFYDQHSTHNSLAGAQCGCSLSSTSIYDRRTTPDAAVGPIVIVACVVG